MARRLSTFTARTFTSTKGQGGSSAKSSQLAANWLIATIPGLSASALAGRSMPSRDARLQFLHFVGDHIYVGHEAGGCAKRLVEAASAEGCAISAVQMTRENLLPFYGTGEAPAGPGKSGLLSRRHRAGEAHTHGSRAAPDRSRLAERAISSSTGCTCSRRPFSEFSPPCCKNPQPAGPAFRPRLPCSPHGSNIWP